MGECGILAFGGAWIPIARRRVGLRLSILSYLHHALSRLVDSTAPAEERPLQLYRIHAGTRPENHPKFLMVLQGDLHYNSTKTTHYHSNCCVRCESKDARFLIGPARGRRRTARPLGRSSAPFKGASALSVRFAMPEPRASLHLKF